MDPVIDNKKTAKNIPVFSLGNPFDNIKIIAHTIMGSPRLNYDWNGYYYSDIWLLFLLFCSNRTGLFFIRH